MITHKKTIAVTQHCGIFRVSADLAHGLKLIPSPNGRIRLAFWDRERMNLFLESHDFMAVIIHNN